MHRLKTFARGSTFSHRWADAGGNTLLDKVGNWTSWYNNSTTAETRSHNSQHQIASRTGQTHPITYDANGNQTKEGNGREYVYDANSNSRVYAFRPSSGPYVPLITMNTYSFDALGRRTGDVEMYSSSSWLYFGQRIIANRYNANGKPQLTLYGYGQYIDEPVISHGVTLVGTSRSEGVAYIHADRVYSTRFTSDAPGQVNSFFDYSAYGQPAARSRGSDGLWYTADDMVSTNTGYVWGFTGRQSDGNNRYHYRARAYDPRQGRFLQRDPLEYVDGYNLYEYVKSGPTVGLDASGRQSTQPCSLNLQDVINGPCVPQPDDVPTSTPLIVPINNAIELSQNVHLSSKYSGLLCELAKAFVGNACKTLARYYGVATLAGRSQRLWI